jgi:hypothetical protein
MNEPLPLATMPGAPPEFPYEEKRVRFVLGLNKDAAWALRQRFLKNGDWIIHKKRVLLSAAALERLLAATGLSDPKKNGGASCSSILQGIQPLPPVTATLRVVRADLTNQHILLACPADQDPWRPTTTVRVRVKSAANFKTGMELPAQLVPGHVDLYDLARALPRRKGAW